MIYGLGLAAGLGNSWSGSEIHGRVTDLTTPLQCRQCRDFCVCLSLSNETKCDFSSTFFITDWFCTAILHHSNRTGSGIAVDRYGYYSLRILPTIVSVWTLYTAAIIHYIYREIFQGTFEHFDTMSNQLVRACSCESMSRESVMSRFFWNFAYMSRTLKNWICVVYIQLFVKGKEFLPINFSHVFLHICAYISIMTQEHLALHISCERCEMQKNGIRSIFQNIPPQKSF